MSKLLLLFLLFGCLKSGEEKIAESDDYALVEFAAKLEAEDQGQEVHPGPK